MSKKAKVKFDQRFQSTGEHGLPDTVIVSEGDILNVEEHGIIHKHSYVMLPVGCAPAMLLLESAISDGWIELI